MQLWLSVEHLRQYLPLAVFRRQPWLQAQADTPLNKQETRSGKQNERIEFVVKLRVSRTEYIIFQEATGARARAEDGEPPQVTV